MNNLTINLLVDRVAKRDVSIFSYLAASSVPVSLDLISEHCHFSKRTILTYIQDFNAQSFLNMEIIIQSSNRISLRATNPSAISLYLNKVTEDNPLFHIIELIFSDTSETIESIADDLFLSESTIKRHLSHLTKELEKYNLHLQLSPTLAITGEESVIRFFYFIYFRYVHDNSILQVRTDQGQSIYRTIASIANASGFALNVDYPRAIYWTTILEQRVKNGHGIYINDSIQNTHKNSTSFAQFKQAFLENFSSNPVLGSLSESELIYAFIVRLDTLTYESNSAFFMNDYMAYLVQFDDPVSAFLSKRKLHPGLYHELKISLQAFLLNTTFLTELTPLFQHLDAELLIQAQHNYPDILNDWMSILDNYTIHFEYSNHIAVSLTLITVSYLQLNPKKKKKILFSFSGNASSINYFKSIALRIVPRDSEAVFIFNQSLSDTLLLNLNIDICVVNFFDHSPISVCPVVKLSTIPLEVEWTNLLSYLYEL